MMQDTQQVIDSTTEVAAHAQPTAYEWVELIHKFWPGAVALGVAYLTYKGIAIKKEVDRRNAIKNASPDPKDVGDETVMRYIASKLKGDDS